MLLLPSNGKAKHYMLIFITFALFFLFFKDSAASDMFIMPENTKCIRAKSIN